MEDVGRSWGWALGFGLLTLVLGILVMVWPEETLRIATVLFGIQLLITGLFAIVKTFGHGQEHRVLSMVLGIIAFVVGIVVLRNVTETIWVVGLILGIYWIVFGVVEFVLAVSDSTYPSRGWSIFLAILSVAAGIVVVSWPDISLTTLTWILGIWFVVLGILEVILSFAVRSESKKELAA